MADDYEIDKIKVLEGLEGVRIRPAMYIGSTDDRGVHHLVEEVVDNSVDEALSGYCNRIDVLINENNSVTVRDNGRGIPVEIHKDYGIPGVEVVMTKLHAGGKFDKSAYKVSGGLHGVGVSVVNALSCWLEVEIRRNGIIYYQRYERGLPVTKLQEKDRADDTGTTVTFMTDPEIFGDAIVDGSHLQNRLQEIAFLNKDLHIAFHDKRNNKEATFQYSGGIAEFVQYINRTTHPLHEAVIYVEGERDDVVVEVALQYTEAYTEKIFSFVNNINTREGGTHLSGLKSALTRTINDYARRNIFKNENESLSGEDVRESITAIVSCKIPDPQFEGQTKTRLGNSEIKGIVETLVNEHLSIYFEENPQIAKVIIDKAMEASRAREAARKARE